MAGTMGPPPPPKAKCGGEESSAVVELEDMGPAVPGGLNPGGDAGLEQVKDEGMGPPPAVAGPNPGLVVAGKVEDEGGPVQGEGVLGQEVLHSDEGTRRSMGVPVNSPYVKPVWSDNPQHPFMFEVLKEGTIVDNLDVSEKSAYMFGRSEASDFVLEHPTSSRFHAVLQYKDTGDAFVYDLGSTHGTFVNKCQVEPKMYVPVRVGDILRFGRSSRLYIFQGPSELVPQQDVPRSKQNAARSLDLIMERKEQAESLRRAKAAAIAAEGISWGMQEDAEEEEEEDVDEITWRTYKGQLTERQQKTLDKVQKRNEKLANLKKEIDSIQAKEIAQGGLTQGQQTQIARNEQRIVQLMEELDNLEETLNDSIRESIGARSGKKGTKKKPLFHVDEDEIVSSDDEFFDRARVAKSRKDKGGEPTVETAESLLEKKFSLFEAMEKLKGEIKSEEKKSETERLNSTEKTASVDPLDAFMTNVSKDMDKDRTTRLTKRLTTLATEADRVDRLLNIADPAKEALKKWEAKAQSSQVEKTVSDASLIASRAVRRSVPVELSSSSLCAQSKSAGPKKSESKKGGAVQDTATGPAVEVDAKPKKEQGEIPSSGVKPLEGPLWLGAPRPEGKPETAKVSLDEVDAGQQEFLEYKDRQKEAGSAATQLLPALLGPSGLILQKPAVADTGLISQEATTIEDNRIQDSAEAAADDDIALLLRHKGGLASSVGLAEEEAGEKITGTKQGGRQGKNRKRRKLGPAKPPHLGGDTKTDYEDWVPPQGQTGDGRTALNEKFGY